LTNGPAARMYYSRQTKICQDERKYFVRDVGGAVPYVCFPKGKHILCPKGQYINDKEPCGSFFRADTIRPYTNCVFFVGDGALDVPLRRPRRTAYKEIAFRFPERLPHFFPFPSYLLPIYGIQGGKRSKCGKAEKKNNSYFVNFAEIFFILANQNNLW